LSLFNLTELFVVPFCCLIFYRQLIISCFVEVVRCSNRMLWITLIYRQVKANKYCQISNQFLTNTKRIDIQDQRENHD